MLDPRQIEDIYPLTPTQRGMLFHSLYAPDSAVYFQQEGFSLRGRFDPAAFVRAWEHVLARHAILRTAIVWEGLDEPVQVVFRQVRLPLEQHDWRNSSPDEQQAQIEAFAQADRSAGFNTAVAPLMRLALIRLADEVYHLIWSRHHLLLDGWSVALILQEVLRAYRALRHGRTPDLAPPQHYRDYIAWLKGQDTVQAEVFWRTTLAGFQTPTPLGIDRPSARPAGQEQYGEQWAQLTSAATAALQTFARTQRVTLNTLFQGAWALMLSRYSGQTDVVFGTTASARPTALTGIESMAGLLISALPVRVQVAPEQHLGPWLQAIQAQQADVRHYDYSSLVDVQRWSEAPRGRPLFESLLVFENIPQLYSQEDLDGDLQVRSVHSFECTNYPLNLAVLPGDGLALRAIYDQDRFEPAAIRRMLGHLQTLLDGMQCGPEQRLRDLALVNPAERRELLALGATVASVEPTDPVQQFERRADETPEAVALVFEQRRWNYRELNERANQLAHTLRARGVGPEVRVGVCLERSPDLAVALLGVLKAGGAFVGLNPADPLERLAGLLDMAEVGLLLTQERLLSGAPGLGAPLPALLRLDADAPTISRAPTTNLDGMAANACLAALVFSAGRATLIERGALAQWLERLGQTLALSASDALLHTAAPDSAAALWEILWPLVSSARLAVSLPEGQEDPDYLRQALAEQAISVLPLSQQALAAVLAAWPDRPAPLRAVLCDGEQPSGGLAQSFQERMGCTLIQLHGPPEAAPQAIQRQGEHSATPVAYLLDDSLQVLPIGVVGELYIGGAGVARGYLNRPDLTAERFVPNPFLGTEDRGLKIEDSNVAGGGQLSSILYPLSSTRLYKTGEHGRRLSDGSIELTDAGGRRVWLGRRRIDLEEVETALLADPQVEDCAVLARATAEGLALLAYLAPGSLAPRQVQARLGLRLPASMAPVAFIPVTHLPLTYDGRVDTRALEQIEQIDAELLRHWEALIQQEVGQAVVLAQPPDQHPAALHLSDLLPGWGRVAPDAPAVPAAPTGQPVALDGPPALADGGQLCIPQGAPETLAEALLQTAARHPQHGIVYIQTDGSAVAQPYPELLAAAQRILGGLQALGLKPGDRALLQLEHLSEHLPVFWACILGGIAPATVAVAPAYSASNSVARKLAHAWELLGHPPILASTHLIEPLAGLAATLPMADARIIAFDTLRDAPPAEAFHQAVPHALAFLQLTSGSTGASRCIPETHRAVLSYVYASREVNQLGPDDVGLNWLPIDHVGALLMFHIRDLVLGCSQVQVRTDTVLAEPLVWLDLIERYRVTHTWAPNFGYKLLADRLAQAHGRSWDLGSIKELLNGGEQVTLAVVREFLERVAPFGIAPEAMQPAYGMAETCTAMTHARGFSLSSGVGWFDRHSLDGRLRPIMPSNPAALALVAVGPPNPGVRIRIVDRDNRVLPEGVIGRLHVQGVVVTPGYLNNPEANREAFTDDGWFFTGDLGVILEGCLTITGREKEVIIVNGANISCHEIEDVVRQLPGVEATSVGVCEVSDPRTGSEGFAVCFTPTVETSAERLALIKAIRARVTASLGLSPAYVLPVPQELFPKTTSGKIQRMQLKAALAGEQFQGLLKQLDVELENSHTLPDWSYRKVWRPRAARRQLPGAALGQALVFLDTHGLGAALCAGRGWVTVELGTEFARLGRTRYRIAPGEPAHYRMLREALARDQVGFDQILHMWTYGPPNTGLADPEAIERAQDVGLYSLLFLAQALGETQGESRPVRLTLVSSGVQAVQVGDELASERAPALGLLKSLPHELPWLICRHVDLPHDDAAANAARLLREIGTLEHEPEVAYRAGRRLVLRLEALGMPPQPPQAPPFKTGGIYLLSGGLGGIGAQLARELRARYDARLLIIGRTALPEKDDAAAGEAASERLQAWHELQAFGAAAVSYAAVDVCDLRQLRVAVEQACTRWGGPLDGVIHLAAVYQDQPLGQATRTGVAAILRPKLLGTWALHQLVKDRPGSLFVAFSSVHSLFGGFGVGAYAAANSFLDSFVHAQRANGLRGTCLAWSSWDGLGLSRNLEVQERLNARGYATIAPEQGLAALTAGLCRNEVYLAIGLDRTKAPIRRALADTPARALAVRAYVSAEAAPRLASRLPELVVHDRFGTRSICTIVPVAQMPLLDDGTPDRQALAALDGAPAVQQTSYVAPQSELERTIAAIWRAALRVEKVGIYDNFFDLGGQSLLMTQVQGKLRAALERDISMVDLFKYPTISALAQHLSQGPSGPSPAPPIADRSARQREAIARQRAMSQRKRDG